MKNHLGIFVGITMLGVAGIVVSQTGLVPSPIQGQLVPGGMMSSASEISTQNYETPSVESSAMPMSDGMKDSVNNTDASASESSMSASTNNSERWDCERILGENEKMCNTLQLDGEILCSDGERECKDECIYPWPFISMCEHSCEAARAECEYNLNNKVGACHDRRSASFSECLEHNQSLTE